MLKKHNYLTYTLIVTVIIGLFLWRFLARNSTLDVTRTSETNKSPELLIGTNADFPPFAYIQDHKIIGFDIDIATEVAQRLNRTPVFTNMNFEMILPELQAGNVQILAAGLTITPERAQRVLFTQPYLGDVPLVIVSLNNNNNLKTLSDLQNKTVIVNDGFTADLYLSKQNSDAQTSNNKINLVRLPTVADAFMSLDSGSADAYVGAENSLNLFLKRNGREKYNLNILPDTSENCALAVSKKYPELLPEIQVALDSMQADGTINKLKTKWGL